MSSAAEQASPADLILAALDGLVAAVNEAGVPATRDPAELQPAGAIIGAPTITGAATLQSIGMTVPVYLVADSPGREAIDWMLAAVALLLPVLGETLAEPTLYTSPINPNGLPAYLISVRVNVANPGG